MLLLLFAGAGEAIEVEVATYTASLQCNITPAASLNSNPSPSAQGNSNPSPTEELMSG